MSVIRTLGASGSICLFFILLAVFLAIFADVVSPFPEQGAGTPNISDKFAPPSSQYWLGTDHLGRDIVSRTIYGARVSLATGVLVVAFSMLIGIPIGIIAGYFGGWVDEVLMRITDMFVAFPALLLAILLAVALGPGLMNCIIAVTVTWWPWYARLARAEALVLSKMPYVENAEVMGVSTPVILARHVLPGSSRPLLVQGALDFGPALLTGAALSFLGLGIAPPTADWGQMVNDGRVFFPERWWYVVVPGLSIFVLALAFSIVGQALRANLGGRADAVS